MRKNGPRRDLMERELLDRAAELFAAKGFAGTSLQNIADAARIGRTTLYHYFKSKNDFLAAMVEDVAIQPARRVRVIRRYNGAPPVAQLREAIVTLLATILDKPLRFRVLVRDEQSLPRPILRRHEEAKRKVLGGVASIVSKGIEAGEFRHGDARVMALSLIGMCTWTAWWFRPDGPMSKEELQFLIADLAVRSICLPAPARDNFGPQSALKSMRSDLARLERYFARKG